MHAKISYDTEKMREDMALRGWSSADLARIAEVSTGGVSLFLSRKRASAKMAAKLATALGYTVRRYFVSVRDKVSA